MLKETAFPAFFNCFGRVCCHVLSFPPKTLIIHLDEFKKKKKMDFFGQLNIQMWTRMVKNTGNLMHMLHNVLKCMGVNGPLRFCFNILEFGMMNCISTFCSCCFWFVFVFFNLDFILYEIFISAFTSMCVSCAPLSLGLTLHPEAVVNFGMCVMRFKSWHGG